MCHEIVPNIFAEGKSETATTRSAKKGALPANWLDIVDIHLNISKNNSALLDLRDVLHKILISTLMRITNYNHIG